MTPIVPLKSELNRLPVGAMTADGLIHSGGFESLNSLGPAKLDAFGPVPGEVLFLLNESITGVDFHR
jgi:hypothetical protein